MKPKYNLVEVEWFDAQSGFGIAEEIDLLIEDMKPIHSFSTGYLIHENEEYIMLGFMLFSSVMAKHYQVIPKGMIKKINILRKNK